MSKPERRDMPQQPPYGAKPATTPALDPKPEAKPKPKPKPKSPSPWPWGSFARIAASLAITFHLLAIFTAPWAIQLGDSRVPWVEPVIPPRTGQGRVITPQELERMPHEQRAILPIAIARSLRHYTNLLYSNNGYNFFSPNPGMSHLLKYEVFDAAGAKVADGTFPDRRAQWPRLFYHRHMMLVDQSNDPNVNRGQWAAYIGDRLLEVHDGERIHLQLIGHHLLTPDEVRAGEKISGPPTYEEQESMDHYRRREAAAANQPLAPGQGAAR